MCNVFLLTFSSRSEPPRDRRCVPHDAATAYRDAIAATGSNRFRSAAGLRGEVCPLPWFNFLSFPVLEPVQPLPARAALNAHRSPRTPRNGVVVRPAVILCELRPAVPLRAAFTRQAQWSLTGSSSTTPMPS